MNSEENERYLLLVPSERLREKKKYCQETCKLKKRYEKAKNNF